MTGKVDKATLTHTIHATAAPVLDFSYVHDKLGRIVHKVETTSAGSHVTDYGYDLAGRLETIQRDGTLALTYVYDANGNRLHEITPTATTSGSYDDQDRQLSWGSQSFQWNASGQLTSRIGPDGTTSYAYDALGNLRSVALPGGASVEYVIDGLDRRVGRKENGVLTRQYLYKDGLKPVAELDGNGELLALYAYAEWSHVPSLMRKGGKTYRIVSDHLGSPRRVIDSDSGAIVQALDYDEWGNVLADSNPGFQPFGFAGGLYDPATGLLRFGARDYDPSTGRWTAKDPIGFAGGDANLYAYAGEDPVSFVDPWGMYGLSFQAGFHVPISPGVAVGPNVSSTWFGVANGSEASTFNGVKTDVAIGIVTDAGVSFGVTDLNETGGTNTADYQINIGIGTKFGIQITPAKCLDESKPWWDLRRYLDGVSVGYGTGVPIPYFPISISGPLN